MKTPKSNAEIQTKEALDHITIMINKQSVRIDDAKYLRDMVGKLLLKTEELRKSRDSWRNRSEQAEAKLK